MDELDAKADGLDDLRRGLRRRLAAIALVGAHHRCGQVGDARHLRLREARTLSQRAQRGTGEHEQIIADPLW